MTVGWSKVRLAIFDMDGTLYNQLPVRHSVAKALLGSALRRRSFATVSILRNYRNLVEQASGAGQFDRFEDCYRQAADISRCSEDEVRSAVDEWMHRRPLVSIRKHRARRIEEIFDALHASGRQIAIWSDYPIDAKLDALDLRADFQMWPGNGILNRLKPDPAGLSHILDAAGIDPTHSLMIGDRFDRDWKAATAIGVPALIRSRFADRRAPTFWRYDDAPFKPLLDGH